MTARPGRPAAILLVGALAAAGAASAPPPTLPSPDLAAVEPAVERQLEEARRAAAAALADPDLEAAARAERIGALGRLYLLYSLLDSAERCFAIARELDPGDPRWSYYPAVLLQRQGRFDEAADRLDAVVAARPRDLPALLRRGQVEIGRDDPAAAAGWFERALELDPASSAALYGLAQVAARRGEPERAARLFAAVLAAQPAASTAHYQLGLVLRQLGDLEGARRHLALQGRGEVTFPDPLMDQLAGLAEGAAVRIAQATRAAGRGDLATARATLEAAVAADPDNLTARLALASNLIRQNEIDAAVEELERVLARDPANPAAHYNLGTAAARRGDSASAIEHLRRATTLDSGFADAFVNLAELLVERGDWNGAVAALDRALELEPGNTDLLRQRAVLNGRLRRFDLAAADFGRVLDHQPRDEPARRGRAAALLLGESYVDAAAHFEESLATLPDSVALRHGFARLLATCPDEAVRDGARALTLAEEVARRERSVEHGQTVAMALAELGRFTEAAALQRQLVEFASGAAPPDVLAELRRRLASYERGEPERAPWLPPG